MASSEIHEGFFLIADITGYTRYLSESELEHAQETLTALLELLVEKTRPPLVISRLAGDAVISYGFKENFFRGQTLLEKIEDTYVAFRKTIERLVLNNTCRCNACANISNLDLKFFVHFGTFGVQRISDHDELVGSDVNLLHRLLKNSVKENTGMAAYALYTQAAIDQLSAVDLISGMAAHTESYEHLGEVTLWIQDLQPIWDSRREGAVVDFPEELSWKQDEIHIALAREQVWDYLVQPQYRNILIGSDRMEVANREGGRIGPGSIYQCYHGDRLVPQTILEWQPFKSMLLKELFPFSHAVSWYAEYCLEPDGEGTRFTRTISKPSGPLAGRTLLRTLAPLFTRINKRLFSDFAQKIEEDYQANNRGGSGRAEITDPEIRDAVAAGLRASSTSS